MGLPQEYSVTELITIPEMTIAATAKMNSSEDLRTSEEHKWER